MAKGDMESVPKMTESEAHTLDMQVIELESNDSSSSGLVLRNVYGSGHHDAFQKMLEVRIKSHDKDIERMCNAHYQGFVDCIHQLLQVRPQAQKLKKEMTSTNVELMKSAENVQRKAEELIRYRRILCSAKSAMEHLSMCLPVLEMYYKLVSQMEEKKYYPALKTLENLELELLPRVSKYRFAQTMCTTIPHMREQIKEASMSDLKDFLENVRKLSGRIGELAMKTAAKQQNLDEDFMDLVSNSSSRDSSAAASPRKGSHRPALTPLVTMADKVTTSTSASGSSMAKSNGKKRRAPAPPNPFTGEVEPNSDVHSETTSESVTPSEDEITATDDLIDFSPVYRCQHIFSCLGSQDQFEEYYRNQRQQQSRLTLNCSPNLNDNIDGYRNYFCGILGFFVIEDHIMNTANRLVTKDHLDDLWENALGSMLSSIRENLIKCTDQMMMLKIKRLVLMVTYAMKNHGFNVDPLTRLLLQIREMYSDILMSKWVITFQAIFDVDNYHPLEVESLVEYNHIISEFPYIDSEYLSSGPKEFPMKFPFSSFVPKVYCEVKQFILSCLQFSQDINASQKEIEDQVRKSTNALVQKTLGTCLSRLIKKKDLGLLQLIQITINTNYLEEACVHLEEFIAKAVDTQSVTESLSSPSTPSMSTLGMPSFTAITNKDHNKLKAKSMFQDARADAESQIYKQLNKKIDVFLELAKYDWLLTESVGTASPYVSELIAFLKATFAAFTNLPDKVAQTACHSACKHMASSLKNFLMEEETRAISSGALEQFNLDLIQCELFSASEPVHGSDDGGLLLCFSELRQLMDLFTSWDWSTYLSDYGKQENKYLRVNPQTALVLLEKVKRAEEKKTIFSALKKNERDKKRLIETVTKQLKQLIINNNSGNN